MDIFAEQTTQTKLQNTELERFTFPSLSSAEDEMQQELDGSRETESRFFVMEDLFKFPTESTTNTAIESPLRFSSNFGLLFEDEPGLKKSISKPKSASKQLAGAGRGLARSPGAKRKLHFASKFTKAKQFSLESDNKLDFGFMKGKGSLGSGERQSSGDNLLATETSTKINSRKSSNDRLSRFLSPTLPFDRPEITNFPLAKLKKIANSFNFEKKREKKPENPLKLEISSFSQPEDNIKFASLVTSILKFSRDINVQAGSSCSSLQSGIERMFQKATDKKHSYEKKVQEVKMRRLNSLLNF